MITENTIIEEQEHGFKGWWHRNQKTIWFVGGVLVVTATTYMAYKNWDAIKGFFSSVKPETIVINNPQVTAKVTSSIVEVVEVLPEITENITKVINGGDAFDVSEHIRNLPVGWKASEEKIAEAIKRGITLLENQTLIDFYTKNVA